jgi:hypothetical protein
MINFSAYKPRVIPVLGDVHDAEIDRAQSIDPSVALNSTKVEEIGRDGAVGYLATSPTVTYGLTQLEYGNIEFYEKITNQTGKGGDGESAITQADFKTPYFDICAYLTDDDATFRGTMWYPALRTSGFGLNIPSPQGVMERNFDLVGEAAVIWQGVNKYLIYDHYDVGSGSDNDIVLSAKPPVVDPDNAGVYMIRVVRVRSGVSTALALTTDYTYTDGTKTLAINSVTAGDVIKYWYTSGTAPTAQFTNNDSDAAGLLGDCASIYLYIPASGKPTASDYIYRLQSVKLDVKFDREDLREIGNKDVVARGVKTTTVTATLGRKLEEFTIEEVLRGAVPDFGKIDVEHFSDEIALIVKIFSDNTKTTFKYGFLCTGMRAMSIKGGASVGNYTDGESVIEGTTFSISADESTIGVS